jgi:hypothetical protein
MTEVTGDNPHIVAFKLLEVIATKDGKALNDPSKSTDKVWILNTYKECLDAVLSIRKWGAYT